MSARQDNAAIVAVGVAFRAVCCVGPILGLLAAIGVGVAAGFAVFGFVGLASALVAGFVLHRRRRRRHTTCTPAPQTVEIGPPSVRADLRN